MDKKELRESLRYHIIAVEEYIKFLDNHDFEVVENRSRVSAVDDQTTRCSTHLDLVFVRR